MYRFTNFNGLHNKSKVKVWLYLAACAEKGKGYISINQIHHNTGVPKYTLRKSMDRWWSWGRLSKKVLNSPLPDGSTCQYRITAFGKKYLEDVVPVNFYNEFVTETVEHQETKRRRAEEIHAEVMKRIMERRARQKENTG